MESDQIVEGHLKTLRHSRVPVAVSGDDALLVGLARFFNAAQSF